jgi:phage replication-related protein YjqB (UPF0714/DUF867 family)
VVLKRLLEHPEVTEICELRGRIGLMAFHGGNLERTTDVVAREVAVRTGGSFYAVLQEAPLREHLPSTAFDPAHSPALAHFLAHVDVAIAIHGYGRMRMRRSLLLGGSNRELARHLATHLDRGLGGDYHAVCDLDAIPRGLRGLDPRNPVNRPRAGGVQLELPPGVRWNRREWGWSDHGGVSRAPQVDRLIDALCAAVAAWQASTEGEPAAAAASTRSLLAP